MASKPMAWGEAMLSLLSQSGRFYDRLRQLPSEHFKAHDMQQALAKTQIFVARLLEPYEPACRRLIAAALEKLCIQAEARGTTMPDGLELRASAGLVLFDWGKSESSSTHLTMRLIATHAEMMDMPICVEEVVPIV